VQKRWVEVALTGEQKAGSLGGFKAGRHNRDRAARCAFPV
jgi:hypothetical protein